jgi:hypothetical protein
VSSDFELQELVADSVFASAAKPRKRKIPFALGPVPLDWWVACDAAQRLHEEAGRHWR